MVNNYKFPHKWYEAYVFNSKLFKCFNCDEDVRSERGYYSIAKSNDSKKDKYQAIYICPKCNAPNMFDSFGNSIDVSESKFGKEIYRLPTELEKDYDKIREMLAKRTYTSAIIAMEKIIAKVCMAIGAHADKDIVHYIKFMSEKQCLGRGAKHLYSDLLVAMKEHAALGKNKRDDTSTLMVIRNHARTMFQIVELLLMQEYEYKKN